MLQKKVTLDGLPIDIIRLIVANVPANNNDHSLAALLLSCKKILRAIVEDPSLSNYAPLLAKIREFRTIQQETNAYSLQTLNKSLEEITKVNPKSYYFMDKIFEKNWRQLEALSLEIRREIKHKNILMQPKLRTLRNRIFSYYTKLAGEEYNPQWQRVTALLQDFADMPNDKYVNYQTFLKNSTLLKLLNYSIIPLILAVIVCVMVISHFTMEQDEALAKHTINPYACLYYTPYDSVCAMGPPCYNVIPNYHVNDLMMNCELGYIACLKNIKEYFVARKQSCDIDYATYQSKKELATLFYSLLYSLSVFVFGAILIIMGSYKSFLYAAPADQYQNYSIQDLLHSHKQTLEVIKKDFPEQFSVTKPETIYHLKIILQEILLQYPVSDQPLLIRSRALINTLDKINKDSRLTYPFELVPRVSSYKFFSDIHCFFSNYRKSHLAIFELNNDGGQQENTIGSPASLSF